MIRETILGLAFVTGAVAIVPPQDTAPEPTDEIAAEASAAADLKREMEALHAKADQLMERAPAVEHDGDEEEAQKMRATAERLLVRAAQLKAQHAEYLAQLRRNEKLPAKFDPANPLRSRYQLWVDEVHGAEQDATAAALDLLFVQDEDEHDRAVRDAKIDEATAKAHELLMHARELQRQGHADEALDILRKAERLSAQANDMSTQARAHRDDLRLRAERRSAAAGDRRRAALDALRALGYAEDYTKARSEYVDAKLPRLVRDSTEDGEYRKTNDAFLPPDLREYTRQHDLEYAQERERQARRTYRYRWPADRGNDPLLGDIFLSNAERVFLFAGEDDHPRPGADGKVADLENRIHSLRAAAENLSAGGFHDRAHELAQEAEELKAHLHRVRGDTGRDDGGIEHRLSRLEDEVHALRGEVHELRQLIEKLHQHVRTTDTNRERAR